MRGFRVWSDYWKRYATEAELYMDGSVDAIFEDDDGVPHHENTDIIVEFDTGLKDKNGEEICEGDIVRAEDIPKKTYEIFWEDEGLMVVMRDCHDRRWEVFAVPLEVIGNIHENPELLEEEE